MGLFIEVVVAAELAADPERVEQLAEVCPVNIFASAPGGGLEIVDDNVDECTLCELCLEVGPPGAVQVLKLYDDRRPLERTAG